MKNHPNTIEALDRLIAETPHPLSMERITIPAQTLADLVDDANALRDLLIEKESA